MFSRHKEADLFSKEVLQKIKNWTEDDFLKGHLRKQNSSVFKLTAARFFHPHDVLL